MAIEAIGLLFIVLASIVYDFTNYKLEERQNELVTKMQRANNYGIRLIMSKHDQFVASLAAILNAEPGGINENEELVDPKLKELAGKYSRKEITGPQFFSQQADIYHNHVVYHKKDYNKLAMEIVELSQDKMRGWNICRSIANVVRIVAILVCAFFYLFLYKLIDERSLKAKI